MIPKYKYYGVKGYFGYVHAECWPNFRDQKSRYNVQGQCASRPSLDSQLQTFHGIRQKRCIHCNRPLLAKPPEKMTTMCETTEKHQAEFNRRCREVYAANPLRDFVRELVDQGVTEQQLQTMLAAQPALPSPFKVSLHNEYRDFLLDFPES